MAGAARDGIARVVVAAVVVAEGTVLLLHRRAGDFMAGLWELPSGEVEPGESLSQALTRELAEESGLDLAGVEAYLGHFDYLSGSGRPTRQFNFRVAVAVTSQVTLTEHDSFAWARPTELATYNLSPEVRQILKSLNLPAEREANSP